MPNRQKGIPARVISARSRKRNPNHQIRIDKLIRDKSPKICIQRRLGGIGDVLMSTPLLKAIKRTLPSCHLIYATDLSYANGALGDVIRHVPYVDQLMSFAESEANKTEYSYVVDITVTGLSQEKSGMIPPNRIDMFAAEAGIDVSDDPIPVYEITPEERERGRDKLKELIPNYENTTLYFLHARSNDSRRTWPFKYVNELADMLAKENNSYVLLFDWGGETDRWEERNHVIPVTNLPLPITASIMEMCDLVICPDSSMLHLAGALRKKTVAIFGPIPPESRINHYNNAISINGKCGTYCWYSPKCAKTDGIVRCLNELKPRQVYNAVKNKLNEPEMVNVVMQYGAQMTNKGQDPIILVKRSTRGLGDMIMAASGIEALKKRYPTKEIHVAALPKVLEVLENNPFIDRLIDIKDNINYKRYFQIYDISSPCAHYEHNRRISRKLIDKSRVEIFAEALGVRQFLEDIIPRYYISEEELEWSKHFIDQINTNKSNKPKVATVLHSAEMYRDWPEEEYKELFNIVGNQLDFVLIDKVRGVMFNNTLDACGLPFRKAVAVVSQCDIILTVDTSILHIGAVLNKPTIALFGPIDPLARCKGYKNTTVIRSSFDCIPCWRNGDISCKQNKHIKGYSECMKAIQAKKVAKILLDKVKDLK